MTNTTSTEITTKQLWQLLHLKPYKGEYTVTERATGTPLGVVGKLEGQWNVALAGCGWASVVFPTQEAAARWFLPLLSAAPAAQPEVHAKKVALWKDRTNMQLVKMATHKFDKSKKTPQDRDVMAWTLMDAGMLLDEVTAFVELKVA